MIARFALPALLFAALLLGGSAQGPANMLLLELLAIGLLAWSYASPAQPWARPARQLRMLAWAAVVIVAVQLVPLPPALWQALPGRAMVAAGDRMLGIQDAWRPLSLMPEATLSALLMLSVPLAIVAAGTRHGAMPSASLAASVVVAAALSVLWGLAQQAGTAPHPYPFSSTGPTGPFANTNHLATLAIAALPFTAALVAEAERWRKSIMWRVMGALFALLLLLTTVLTGSLAMIVLGLPVLLLSVVIATRASPNPRLALAAGLIVAVGAIIGLIGLASVTGDASISASTRAEIWRNSMSLSPYMVTGGGFGAFPALYALVEDPFGVDRFFVNHAHNELIELAIEGGVVALALLTAILVWWVRACITAWRPSIDSDPFARAGGVAAMVLFLHSLVDFPMRTEAHLALMAASLLLLAQGRPPTPVQDKRDLRPTRHRRVDGSAPADNRR